jgi:uncharacterized protein (TIGR02646 family)
LHPVPHCPQSLSPERSLGADERARAIAHFTSAEWTPAAKFTFSVYQHEEVREALLSAFDRVCAYCEAPVPSIEIEHYRPKAAVRTDAELRRPGYYWLASTWENLLPSCHYCNKDLWTEFPNGPRRKSGKGNWFPLEDEGARATKDGEEARERPQLLHPYHDEPLDHLEFVEEGVVAARRDADGRPSIRGKTTIDLLGLNRRGLPEARRDRQIILDVAREHALEAQRRCQAHPHDEALAETHWRCVAELERLLKPSAGFSGMAAQRLELT